MIEVYSDGLDVDQYGTGTFRPEFTTNGMFVINSEKINVTYGRRMNVLSYDPLTGSHHFEVFMIISLLHEEIENLHFVSRKTKSMLLFCLVSITLIHIELKRSLFVNNNYIFIPFP